MAITVSFPLLVNARAVVNVHITDPGLRNHLENNTEAFSAPGFTLIDESPEKKQRGVFGYFSWGLGSDVQESNSIVWLPSEYINYRDQTFYAPVDVRPNYFRIFPRKGVRGNFVILTTNFPIVPAALVTP